MPNEIDLLITNEADLSIYSKTIPINYKLFEVLPKYLRFVKGVIDCEDLPLNVSI